MSPLRTTTASLLLALFLPVPLLATESLDPPGTGGVEAVDRALAELATNRRLLIVGAHPDDEDTRLLAHESLVRGGEAAYLSLTRGEGGQNVIGDDLGEALGVLRSRELLAAREIDGARQFFGRAYDYGYSKTLDEALRFWPRDELLEDVVRVTRRFRPQVVVSVFPSTSEAGHGQHQAAGWVTERAFRMAGEAGRFPELAAEGLVAWQPRCLYREAWWRPERATLTMATDVIDPLRGHTISQLAARSRSRHRSQTMGRLEELAGRAVRLERVEMPADGESDCPRSEAADPFGGLDTRLTSIADLLVEPTVVDAVRARLARVEQVALAARRDLVPDRLAAAVEPLATIVDELAAARAEIGDATGPGGVHAAALLAEKSAVAERALAAAAGLVLDASVESATLVPGETVSVAVRLLNGGPYDLLMSGEPIAVSSPLSPTEPVTVAAGDGVAIGELLETTVEVEVAEETAPTVPYFLRRPRDGWLYDLSEAASEVRGEPFGPPVFVASVDGTIAGTAVRITRPVTSRRGDPVLGEVRRPLRVVPRLEVAVQPALIVRPLADRGRRQIGVTLSAHGERPVAGRLVVESPDGWQAVAPQPFRLSAGETTTRTVELEPTEAPTVGRSTVSIAADVDGERFAAAYPLVDYDHVAPTPIPAPAEIEVVTFRLELPELERVGYVRGAADAVPEALAAVGIPVETLTPSDLGTVDLSGFDAVVVGPRAYEAHPELFEHDARLMAYGRAGGLIVVQYQQPPYAERAAPYSMTMPRRGAPRTVDETAAVELVAADHRVLTRPNRIDAADWEGWIQERGLYYPATWSSRYTPLLAMADPGEEPERGALLIAPLGDGHYVYTGLAFFRQLPAGVAGAYRLFANILALEPSTIEEEEIGIEALELEEDDEVGESDDIEERDDSTIR